MRKTFLFSLFVLFLVPAVSFADTCVTYTTDADDVEYGMATTKVKVGQMFSLADGCDDVSQLVVKGSRSVAAQPTDDAQFTIQADSAGSPSGTALVTASCNITAVRGSAVDTCTLTLDGTTDLSPGDYWLVFERTGADTDADFYYTRLGGTQGGAKLFNGSSWGTEQTWSAYMVLTGTIPLPPTPIATSTFDQTQQNLSTAFFLFFVSMFGTIWLMRKH